ncbi:conjugal transfer protein TraG N-terminal domain-containing protein [Pokkaliibacter sp. MBI-7]|uniref:conjugal transfer protein TraG N-terminal domain-containing protein n=1 Tax=Pokkaliibacter sp. MBI-7 TaxID=3040600 RepID=UPI00244CBD80|nr:conjugal transfer protein TraG N-terminal domain-containing protein [Pokkaliibacter sp. MBI-7]MDH2430951.1 conjugal transfer protein TraG N-terminal domain-containing protein [Pokkaliibacter sp. MBI-7]MDH2434717.1 conjugal transfer protein TraG N-terminal domain-containing protein [Pokkaliibacter sp. MBI-7]MDH2436688.1 conjugal transfer protein TraG N-terminal domain-containing protein [Pokkaliibacter sp. MBI-7]
MIMAVDSHLEYSMVLLGWYISEKIWAVLSDSGVFAIPLMFMVYSNFAEMRRQGADEGNKGALGLNNLEIDLYQALIVILIALQPFINVNLKVVYPPNADNLHSAQCSMSDQGKPAGGENAWTTGFASVNGMTPQVPFWWWSWHVVAKMITYPAIASIPCEINLRQVKYELNQEYISGGLAAELGDFARDCFAVSKSRLTNLKRADYYKFNEEQLRDVDWVGSNYFLTTPGYYDTHHASLPNPNFPYDAARDVALPNTGAGGYPTCKQWWSDSKVGLAARAKAELTDDLLEQLFAIGVSDEDLLRTLMSSTTMERPGRAFRSYGYSESEGGSVVGAPVAALKTATAAVGMGVATATVMPAMYLVQTSLPMVQSMLMMALIISMPIVMVMGSYSFATLMSITLAYCALVFMTFWWELARFVDNKLVEILYSSPSDGSLLGYLADDFDNWVSDFVTVTMFLVWPAFFLAAMGWAGYKMALISDGMGSGTKSAGDAGKGAAQFFQQITGKGKSKGDKGQA